MAFLYPTLSNGRQSNQSIYQVIQVSSTAPVTPTSQNTAQHDIGTRASFPDGRVYYYASNTSTALTCGNLLQTTTTAAAFLNIAVASNVGVGSFSVPVTLGSSQTIAASAYAGGYLVINAGAGIGNIYRIREHAAVSASTSMTLVLADPIQTALTSAASKATVMFSPWANVVASSATTNLTVGVAPVAVSAGSATVTQYFWAQTWGLAAVTGDASSLAVGSLGIVSATAGSAALDLAASVTQIVGIPMVAGASTEARPFYLTIAP